MKIVIGDAMPGLRERAEARINAHFDALAAGALHRDQEHARKRGVAERWPDVPVPEWFEEAAAVEGMTVAELVQMILQKPDDLAVRGNDRRRAVVAVRAAATPAAVAEAVKAAGIQD